MRITTEITVTVERADGTTTTITERREARGGGNPRYEADECAKAIQAAVDTVNQRLKREPAQ
jgi:hypothetical protein